MYAAIEAKVRKISEKKKQIEQELAQERKQREALQEENNILKGALKEHAKKQGVSDDLLYEVSQLKHQNAALKNQIDNDKNTISNLYNDVEKLRKELDNTIKANTSGKRELDQRIYEVNICTV